MNSQKFGDANEYVTGILSLNARIESCSDHYTKGRRVMDWKLELVQVPVSDVDRAKAFYTEKIGFNEDHDHRVSDEIRFVQLTPPGSACSIAIGSGLSEMPPGSVQGLQLVVSDIEAARAELVERGVEVSEVQEFDWGSFVFFNDPDGNGWSLQQIPARD
jgi:catechol 2,3-dioxygenase-like lactoylglutathione lyase family enzyme